MSEPVSLPKASKLIEAYPFLLNVNPRISRVRINLKDAKTASDYYIQLLIDLDNTPLYIWFWGVNKTFFLVEHPDIHASDAQAISQQAKK